MTWGNNIFKRIEDGAESMQFEILKLIWQSNMPTRSFLAAELNVSKSLVGKAVQKFIDIGACTEGGLADSNKAGRRRVVLRLNEDFKYILILDLGLVVPVISVSNFKGELLASSSISFEGLDNFLARLSHLYNSFRTMLREHKIDEKKIGLCALSSPGTTCKYTGIIEDTKGYEDWDLNRFSKEFGKCFHVNCFVYNDVNCASWGEFIHHKDSPGSMIYIAGGNSLRAGIILDSKLYCGFNGRSGSFGDLLVRGSKIASKNGKSYIKLDDFVSMKTFLDYIKKEAPEETKEKLMKLKGSHLDSLTLSDIKTLLQNGDDFVNESIEYIIDTVATALINLGTFIDVESFIIGGEYTQLMPYFGPIFENYIKKELDSPDFTVSPSQLGELAGSYGIANMAVYEIMYDFIKSLPKDSSFEDELREYN